MGFSPAALLAELQRFPPAETYWVAFSGGCDSLALLHALVELGVRLPARLRALHADHGLQPESAAWARDCQHQCAALNVPLEVMRLGLAPVSGQSLEAVAREARYLALGARIGPGDLLLTAHHQDDQAETLLLQLLRGSGVSGLAGMPSLAPLGVGQLARPLLAFARREIEDYARGQGLVWIDDPSNRKLDFDRNYLRHRVIPQLRARWPGLSRSLARSARHCGEARTLIDELARRDLAAARDEGSDRLQLEVLRVLPAPRCRALLRRWIREQGRPVPPTAALDRILDELLPAPRDRRPEVKWSGGEVRRFRDGLYLLRPLPALDPNWRRSWDGAAVLVLPAGLGRLLMEPVTGHGIAVGRLRDADLTVGFRQGGERCRPVGAARSRRLKQLLQEAEVPPWERARLPLLWLDGELAAVGDLWVCENYAAGRGEPGLRLRWERGDAGSGARSDD
jgi:tRNA(Ile)-lysidine synthase